MNVKIESLRKKRDVAMPEVKRLVKKFGRPIVQGCLNQLHDYEKKLKQLEIAKREVARLQHDVK